MLGNGLTGGAGFGAYVGPGGYTTQASKGTATGFPQGPQTATQAGFGTIAGGGDTSKRALFGFITAGTASLALLFWIWWSLPR